MADAVKLSSGAFKSLMGLDASQYADPVKQPDNVSFIKRFTKSEIQSFLRHIYVKPELQRTDLSGAGILNYLKPVHKIVGERRLNVDKMRALAPEIEQSKILVSASIMSPNDLQDGVFTFSFEGIPEIEEDSDLSTAISEVYDEFYNHTLQLGIKSYDWIGEIQYSTGSKCLLILPVATQIHFHDRTPQEAKKDLFKFGPGFANIGNEQLDPKSFASFEEYCHKITPIKDDFFLSEKPITWKDALEGSPNSMLLDMQPAMESFGVMVPTALRSTAERSRTQADLYGQAYMSGLESMIVNLRTKLEEGDLVRITENPEVLRFNSEKRLVDKHEVWKKLHQKYHTNQPVIEEVVELEANPEGIAHVGHPTIIELPSEAVVPIFIPGAPKEHIGYFILLDQHGQPLTIEASGMAKNSQCCEPGTVNAAYEAVFGAGCCANQFFNSDNSISSAGNMVFQHLIDKYIKARLKGIFGRSDLEIARFNGIATVMFYRLLEKKRTMLCFVSPEMLHYFAFEYDKCNGVGISKLLDIDFLLSLRTTLMIADIIAKMNNSVEHKVLEFNVDDKNANLEGMMDLLAQQFIAKNKINGSLDPSEIASAIEQGSLVMLPKNLPGIQNLDLEVTSKNSQNQTVDNDLMEQLTNLIVSHLDVPPSALNQMAEPEFSRSLVTYNLFFAKKITRYQRIWCELMERFIRVHSSFDIPFKKALMKKLKAANKKSADEKLPDKVKELAKVNPNHYRRNLNEQLAAIMNNVRVHLPSPQIVVDKTQFEEIRNFTSNLDEMANQLFSQDIIPSDDSTAQTAMTVMRAKWKRDQMLKFIERVGTFSMVDVPEMEDVELTEILDYIQVFQNFAAGLQKQRETLTNSGMDQMGGGYGEMGGGFGGEMGGGFGAEGGMGMEEGGGFEMESTETSTEMPAGPEEGFPGEGEGGEAEQPAAQMYVNLKRKRKK